MGQPTLEHLTSFPNPKDDTNDEIDIVECFDDIEDGSIPDLTEVKAPTEDDGCSGSARTSIQNRLHLQNTSTDSTTAVESPVRLAKLRWKKALDHAVREVAEEKANARVEVVYGMLLLSLDILLTPPYYSRNHTFKLME